MHNLRNCARKAHKHPIIDIYLPIFGRIYPIPENICQLLAEYIQYKNISPNCWQNISSIRIYTPIVGRTYPISEHISPSFGRIYPIPIYIYSTIHIIPIVGSIHPIQIYETRSLGPLRGPTSSLGPCGPPLGPSGLL